MLDDKCLLGSYLRLRKYCHLTARHPNR
ncbi:hypothetical protein V12B01_13460 [Vibrio splendidus 12B01]|nr:hypothetical protein V12B01_13460 [Vibrio splendidus 12B01]